MESSDRIRWAELGALGVALVWLMYAASEGWGVVYGRPLNPDLSGFIDGALTSTIFFDSGVREPLHVFLIKIAIRNIAVTERALRLLSLAETLLMLLAFFWATRRVIGRGAAAVGVVLMSLNPMVMYYALEGMRAPLFTALLIVHAGLQLGPEPQDQRRRWQHALLIGLVGGLAGWTRTMGLGVCALLTLSIVGGRAVRAWRGGKGFALDGPLMVAGLLPVVMYFPVRLFRDDGILAQNLVYLRNVEKTGLPGDWQTAEPIGLLEFLFVEHTPGEMFGTLLSNLWLLFVEILPDWFRLYSLGSYGVLSVFVLVGIGAAVWRGRGALAVWWLVCLGTVWPFLHIDLQGPGTGLENRLLMHLSPASWWLGLWMLQLVLHAVAKVAKRPAWLRWLNLLAPTDLPRPVIASAPPRE